MRACIIAVGSELLTPFRIDTNSLAITERLNVVGFDVRLKTIVGDDVEELIGVLTAAMTQAELVVVTGGLGPTEDDLTRDALARVLDVPLEFHPDVLAGIRERFVRRALQMPEINRRQAMVPRGAALIANPNGTAPGLWVERGRTAVLALPGPPREMTPMLDTVIRERLSSRSDGAGLFRRVVRITGRTESDVDQTAQPIYSRWTTADPLIATTILAVLGQIELHLTATSESATAAAHALDAAVNELKDVLGSAVYSTDGRSLERVVGELLRDRRLTVAVAESCTGGLITSRLTDVPGSSEYVERGVVCYSNRAKIELVNVSEDLIREHGAVSEPVARAMAEGIRAAAGTHAGVGVTGIAGPGGGTPEKPVGTVVVAVTLLETPASARTFTFAGDREMVKFQASQAALNMLRLMIA